MEKFSVPSSGKALFIPRTSSQVPINVDENYFWKQFFLPSASMTAVNFI